MFIDWGAHPDPEIEQLVRTGAEHALLEALRTPRVGVDPFAQLLLFDRLRALRPGDANLLATWMPAMLMTNRPAPVHAITRHWPADRGPAPPWRLIAAQVAQTMGDRDEARRRYQALLAACPDMIDAWQKYFEFESAERLQPDAIARVRTMLAGDADPYVREKAAFALAAATKGTDPLQAFRLATAAHALKRQRQGAWSRGELESRLAADRACTPQDVGPAPGPRPVFVVGLPRSGTTLLERMLGSHSCIAGVGEQPLLASWAARRAAMGTAATPGAAYAAAWYKAALHDLAGGAQVVVDKLPANAEHVGLILATFADALVLWLERDLADCAMSIHLHDFEAGLRYADDVHDLAAYAGLLYRHLQGWRERAPERVLHLRYEDLLDDPARALEPLLSRTGLQWESSMLDFWQRDEQSATFSEAQVRRPVNRDAVGAWRRYLPDAEAFVRALGVTP
ncbi:MAG: sulfotransferase [Rubrivivax sp.]|nr:sulfotransferase [Rubrivivax sp.]